MPSIYKRATDAEHQILNELILDHYKDINAVGVSFDIIFAYAGENDAGEKIGPALKERGYQCNATCGIVNLKNRVMGLADAEIILDGDTWEMLDDLKKKAIIDHELYHFIVAKNVQGELILDTHGRPKLKMRQHDVQVGWFAEIAARHGNNSAEVEQAAQVVQRFAQSIFPFLGQQPLAIEPAKKGAK